MTDSKRELFEDDLDKVAGGVEEGSTNVNNNNGSQISQQGDGNQINNQNGNMANGLGGNIIQNNTVEGNVGDVKIGSPVNLSGGENNTFNLNF